MAQEALIRAGTLIMMKMVNILISTLTSDNMIQIFMKSFRDIGVAIMLGFG